MSIALAIAVTAIVVSAPLAYILWRQVAANRRHCNQIDRRLDAITKTVVDIDERTEVIRERLKHIRREVRQQSPSEVDTQPVNHLRVIGGYRGTRGA